MVTIYPPEATTEEKVSACLGGANHCGGSTPADERQCLGGANHCGGSTPADNEVKWHGKIKKCLFELTFCTGALFKFVSIS